MNKSEAKMFAGAQQREKDSIARQAKLEEALRLLLCGAEAVQRMGVVQPQLNGGVVLAQAVLKQVPK